MEYIHHYDSPLGGITMASDGNALTGYAGGIEKKARLLALEQANISTIYVQKQGKSL